MSFAPVLTTNGWGRNAPAEQANDRGRSEVSGLRSDPATRNGAAVGAGAEPGRALLATSRASSDGGRHTAAAGTAEVARREPFAIDVQRSEGVAIVQPRGDLDLATVEPLRAALDDCQGVGRLVLDLRGLSFLDCAGLHLLVALHERAQREGFQLALLAPAAPTDKPIKVLGLDQALPFVAPDDALDRGSASGPAPGGMGET